MSTKDWTVMSFVIGASLVVIVSSILRLTMGVTP